MMETSRTFAQWKKQRTSGKITVDSGAAESVWPEGLMPEIQTKPSVGSRTGVTYIAASGNRMPNLGEKKVHFKTKDGLNSSNTFQVTKAKMPLAAVSKITATALTAWTWSTLMSQVLRGWTGGKELDKTVQT